MKQLLHIAATVASLSALLTLGACGAKNAASDAEPVAIGRLDRAVASYASADSAERAALVAEFGPQASVYGQMMGLPADLPADSAMLLLARSRMMQVFQPDVEERLPSLDSVALTLGATLGALRHALPSLAIGDVWAIVSPAPHKIVVVDDSVPYVALNHYLGPDYPGYQAMPAFEVAEKRPDRIPYDVAEALVATQFPFSTASPTATVANRMLYDGALVNAVVNAVPQADIFSLLGYSDADRQWIEANEAVAWNALVAKDLLYSTSEMDAAKLLRPAPRSFLIAPDAPPRLGRYFGYRIVQAYLASHPSASQAFFLSPDFYLSPQSFIEAAYVPGKL